MKLVDTQTAVFWTRRRREVLYRWAREHRITRHGSESRRKWNLEELPAWAPGEPQPQPPPKKTNDTP